jgi:hypothetical protein
VDYLYRHATENPAAAKVASTDQVAVALCRETEVVALSFVHAPKDALGLSGAFP